ncbi:MAG: hypothetical protein V4787_19480 [Pseudomonadota bacterium]
MKRVGPSPLVFTTGIDKIIRSSQAPAQAPPSINDIAPSMTPTTPRLEQLYPLFNLEDYVARQVAPALNEAALMLPRRFDPALAAAMALLDEGADDTTLEGRVLRRARRLLKDQVGLRDLLRMYRSALLQG